MNIGIIAEGTTDHAVLENILKAFNIDNSNVIRLRPELRFDSTDKQLQNRTFGGWQYVKKDCIEREVFDKFFFRNENKYIVIQIDTAECEEIDFGVKRPIKTSNPDYSVTLRTSVKNKINEWLNYNYSGKLFYAVCIEEIEAWILTKYEQTETASSAKPKEKLQHKLSNYKESEIFYKKISKEFSKKKKYLEMYVLKNKSFKDFVDSLESLKSNL